MTTTDSASCIKKIKFDPPVKKQLGSCATGGSGLATAISEQSRGVAKPISEIWCLYGYWAGQRWRAVEWTCQRASSEINSAARAAIIATAALG